MGLTIGVIICCQNSGKQDNKREKHWSLIKSGELKLPLDSTSGFMTFCMQPYSYNDKEYLYFNNFKTGVINVYDLNLRAIVEKIKFEKEGPDNVGTSPWAFYVHNKDSIFVLSHMDNQLSLIDKEGNLLDKHYINTDYWNGEPIPWASTDMPMRFDNKNKILFIPGVVRVPKEGYSAEHALIVYNVITNDFSYSIPYPKLYDAGFWVEDNYTRGYTTPNLENEELIYGFGVDHMIHSQRGESYSAKSNFLGDFKPVFKKYQATWDDNISHKQLVLSGAYSSLISDNFNKVYYRVVNLPVSEENYEKGIWNGGYSIIIIDENFQVRGEIVLEDGLRGYMIFLDKNGLNIANEHAYKMNEDSISFAKFKLVR
jgi:hypothetical protein